MKKSSSANHGSKPSILRPLRRVPLPEDLTPGTIYLTSMPGRYEPLSEFLEAIRRAGVTHVLCLVSDAEIAKKSPDYLAAIKRDGIPVPTTRFEIPDYGLPENDEELRTVLAYMRRRLADGESVVIHCAGGHGRTGMVATLLLMEVGLPLHDAEEIVEIAGSAPDTEEQRRFLRQWKAGKPED